MGQPPSPHCARYSVACELLVVTNWNCGGASGALPLVRAGSVRDAALVPVVLGRCEGGRKYEEKCKEREV